MIVILNELKELIEMRDEHKYYVHREKIQKILNKQFALVKNQKDFNEFIVLIGIFGLGFHLRGKVNKSDAFSFSNYQYRNGEKIITDESLAHYLYASGTTGKSKWENLHRHLGVTY